MVKCPDNHGSSAPPQPTDRFTTDTAAEALCSSLGLAAAAVDGRGEMTQ